MIPVKVQKITYYHPNRSYAVILKELDGDRRLPVLIGAFEAQSIAMAMESMETPRPLTHDLISNLIKGINANLSSVKIIELKDGVFYSVLDIQSKKIGHREIDSRPSDALALALRMHAPIFVSTDIMDEAIILEKDLQNIEDEIKQEPMIETLEKQLQKAIQEEEYEVAARIRDKIKNI
jgi:bifunctional DNase/RNase|tara:strand:+ start:1400 stop:1936 length:537 start_codon:yes stop_codon:yes gene_type:complete